MPSLQHAKRLSKRQMSTDVRSKQHPPIIHICYIFDRIVLDLANRQECLFSDNRLPILNKVRSTK